MYAAAADAMSAVTPAGGGVYYVRASEGAPAQTWRVDARYDVRELIGHGSYGSVCRVVDAKRGAMSALKRVPNALASEVDARRTLREIVALHRMNHPNVCELRHAFYRESAEGAKRLDPTTMTLRSTSIDVYLSFEYAEGGDVFALRGQLSGKEVRGLMQQAAEATRYLHGVGIWHRDIKSANMLLGKHRYGGRVIKICDFGSARCARARPMDDDAAGDGQGLKRRRLTRTASTAALESATLTQFVMTPCYRAPEVIMGGVEYTGAVDVWALGCIFAELLQRQVSSDLGALNQKLTVKPLFGFEDTKLASPPTGEHYDDGECSESAERRQAQLDTLFNVIGTPAWAEIARIKSPHWREYLRSLPGRAGNLDVLFQRVDDTEALDLLRRMLQFDPTMRASCEEILAHRYFAPSACAVDSIKASTDSLNEEAAREVEAMSIDATDERRKEFWEIDHPGLALEELEKAFVRVRESGEKAWQDEYRIFFEKECARSERLVDSEMVEKGAQDKSLLALFPDFFRGEQAVEYKLVSNNDEREVVHHYGFAEGGSEAHLNRDRMGEWTNQDWDSVRPKTATPGTAHGVWGVTVAPPGQTSANRSVAGQQGR